LLTVAANDFTHLHVHSEFSLLDGLGRVNELVAQAKKLGFDSLAITDHGALYGAVAFYQACKAAGIKPILGVETYVARRSMADREGRADDKPYHLVLLAKDWAGYQNLCRLMTAAHLDGYYYKPRIDREILAQHSEGLVGMSACLAGEVARAIEFGDRDEARRVAGTYGDIFGAGNFYLELQDHGLPEQQRLNPELLRLAQQTGLPLVVTNDLHYVTRDQAEAHDVLLCVGTGSNLDTPGRMRFEGTEFYLKSAAEMASLFPEMPEAVSNTRLVAEMVDLELPLGQTRLPDFPVPEGQTVETWLRSECERGLVARYGEVTPGLRQRLDYELGVIISMGYAAYFLIVADFVRFAREQGIATTCRGSAPGSIVTYTLGITPVDPILYELPFERFLNPDRVTMPDIDVDFEDARRGEVIDYVARKYGADHVAQIITFGTMLARAAIRDVGRVLGFGYGEVDRIAKAVPNQLGIKLEEALQVSPPLREMRDGDPRVRKLLDLAEHLEGVSRNASTHAAGVVISHEPLTELMPLQRATNSDGLMTQYEMHGVEALGLLKFDFLGLSNLTILRQAVDLIAEQRGEQIDLEHIPLDDARTFELLASGETTGVFQLESPGMRRYVKELRPTSVLDLAAMVALFRPGPMDNIPAYIRRKHGEEKVTYLHPLLEPYLRKTYGIFVYQEDIMAASMALGGFTGPEADTLGYAIRKKKSDVLRAQKAKFVERAAERGVQPHVIDAVFKAFEPFERYGFNKAHATCYGLIAYQTAYLKANYTVEYMTSVLTAVRDSSEKVAAAIAECRRLGIEVLPPDVHRSGVDFSVEGNAIRFGMLAIKNVGEGAIRSIIDARADGEFKSLRDFCSRVDLRLVNMRVLEALTWSGALSRFGNPAQILDALPTIVPAAQADAQTRATGQISAFDALFADAADDATLPMRTEPPARERMRHEKELLGLYLSGHPLGDISSAIDGFVDTYSSDLGEELDQQRVVVGGIVTAMRRVITKARATMAVATLEDLQGTVEVIVFPKVLEQTEPTWVEDAILLVAGRVDHKGEETVLLADSVWTWEEVQRLGPGDFTQQVARGDRGRRNGRRANGATNGHAPASGGSPGGDLEPLAVQAREPVAVGPGRLIRQVPLVSPLRGGGVSGTLDVYFPTVTGARPFAAAARAAVPDQPFDDESPLPIELATRELSRAQAPTLPVDAGGRSLHIRFSGIDQDRIVDAFQRLRALIHARPGDTHVVLHVPSGPGRDQRMELRVGVAYDGELVALLGRTLGEGSVRLSLE
jgi:DNA polymerase-3 subunit alpha